MGAPLLMNKNLLYTGITRAKQMVVLVGSIKAVQFMISNNRSFERYSALRWRISDIIDSDVFEKELEVKNEEGSIEVLDNDNI
jgi:exodeoxyribonuclease V alpha subunit